MMTAHANNRFRKEERLSSKKRIDLLFQEGKSKYKGSLCLKYLFCDQVLEARVQVMFSVPKKKIRRAVDRNLLKRRMREAYRLSKHDLIDKISSENQYLILAFLFVGNTIEEYSKIDSDLKGLIAKTLNPKS